MNRKTKSTILLVFICIVCVAAIALGIFHFKSAKNNSDVVYSETNDLLKPNGIIVNINSQQKNDSISFEIKDLYPGDKIHRSYQLNISHNKDAIVQLSSNISTQSKLSEVLKATITSPSIENPLYDGLIVDMPVSLDLPIGAHGATNTQLAYDLIIYLDPSVGNEYMNSEVRVDFKFAVDDADALIAPGCHNYNVILIALLSVAICLLIILLIPIKKEEEECNEIEIPPEI